MLWNADVDVRDSYDRAAYMPGVAIAVRKVMTYTGMIYGFEHFID